MRIPFPDRPEQRRMIVALSEAEYDRCGYDDEGRALLADSGTWVVPVPLPEEARKAPTVQRLLDQAVLFEGQVLLQSPYRFDDYAPAESYTERMAIRKHFLFSELCRRLGAKRVQVSTVATLTREGTVSLDVTGNKKLAKGELHVEKGHAAFHRRSKVNASTASRSECPNKACSTITDAITSPGIEGRPRPEGNRSANNVAGNNRSRCSASNANTLPGSSKCPATDSTSSSSRCRSDSPCTTTGFQGRRTQPSRHADCSAVS